MTTTSVDLKSLNQHFAGLKEERSGWEDLWRDIRDYEAPDLGAFGDEKTYQGGKRYQRLYDAEAAECADTLAAGLLGGVSSPSRPWLRLTSMDEDLDSEPDVKEFLAKLQKRLLLQFSKSEVYNALHRSYIELGVFGTACSIVQAHPDRIIDMMNLTIGEYWLADDPWGRVDTMYRRIMMTARQMAAKFGEENLSSDVRSSLRDAPFKRFSVLHAIMPRQDYDETKRDSLNFPYASIYWEEGRDNGRPLGESGYRSFPVLAPRWITTAGSVYGRGPGAKSLSASKALQRMQYRMGILTDYLTDPPVQVPSKLFAQAKLFRPGGRIPVDPSDVGSMRTAWEVKTSPDMLQAQIAEAQRMIQRYFNVNVFQMIQAGAQESSQRTATEIAALEQEKVMLLGPVLERLHTELLDPLINISLELLLEAGQFPDVPRALEGKELSIEYISVLAEQQKSSETEGILRTIQQIGVISQLQPEALDKLDADKAIDLLADQNHVPPSMIVTDGRVALVRKQRAEQQEAAQAQESAIQSAAGLKDLAQAAQASPSTLDIALSQSADPTGGAL